MKIILVGAGRMGQEIAARLVEEGHDITVVDNDAGRLGEVSNCVDAMVLFGSGADYTVLAEAGVGDADLLIAVTSDDSVNMLCCLTGGILTGFEHPHFDELSCGKCISGLLNQLRTNAVFPHLQDGIQIRCYAAQLRPLFTGQHGNPPFRFPANKS